MHLPSLIFGAVIGFMLMAIVAASGGDDGDEF